MLDGPRAVTRRFAKRCARRFVPVESTCRGRRRGHGHPRNASLASSARAKSGYTIPARAGSSPKSSPRATASRSLRFVPEHSLGVANPPRVDVVVAEVFGNFAYEENVLETLRDAHRLLAPGGTLIPRSIVQWAAPVRTERFDRDLRSWRDVGFGLDFYNAERVSRNNMYVFAIEPD